MKCLLRVSVLVGVTMPMQAGAENLQKALQQLEPETRLIQACDQKGLVEFSRDKRLRRTDRVIIDACGEPAVDGHTATGNCGALRAGGVWIRFSYTCTTTADRMAVTSFNYKLGDTIPKEDWERFGLY